MALQISDTARNTLAEAFLVLFNGGNLYIRTGAQPANCAAADSGTLLSTNPLSNPAINGSAAGGVATFNTITDATVAATNTAAHFRLKSSGGTTHMQGTVGTSAANINFNTVAFVTGAICSITTLTLTMPES